MFGLLLRNIIVMIMIERTLIVLISIYKINIKKPVCIIEFGFTCLKVDKPMVTV